MTYMTEQRKLLYEFFTSHPHSSFCAKDIYGALKEKGISMSAVYRNLAAMKKDGYLTCFADESSRDTYYRFTSSAKCSDAIHLTCTDCGKTFHMDSDSAKRMQKSLRLLNGFCINKDKTVLYGTCRICNNKVII